MVSSIGPAGGGRKEEAKMRNVGLALASVVLWGVAASAASPPDPQCILNAQNARKACKTECQDNYVTDIALCRNIDPACLATCRQQRDGCLAPLLASLDACTGQCDDQLQAAKDMCPPPGDPNRDACVDAAQVVAFLCRDNCREQWRADTNIQTGLHFCRKQFKQCIQACPPPPSS